eukprot:TRINITY_DN21137_c0_g1_i1.p1 TRINITY_DN21137_c0_g1~~TRINITY_DN21137_c0_g1_i1.p1  ORF type:complete len:341 (+),score=74.69 TRINITY_DN21137_c0_g1_i1:47-1069(+)
MLLRPVFDERGNVRYAEDDAVRHEDDRVGVLTPASIERTEYSPPAAVPMFVSVMEMEPSPAPQQRREQSPSPVYLPGPPPPVRGFSVGGESLYEEMKRLAEGVRIETTDCILPRPPPQHEYPVQYPLPVVAMEHTVVRHVGGDDEFFSSVLAEYVAEDEDDDENGQQNAADETALLRVPHIPHPLGTDAADMSRPCAKQSKRKFKNKVLEPYGQTWSAIKYLVPHMSPLYLADDVERAGRLHYERLEEFQRDEAGARLAFTEKWWRSWYRLLGKIHPVHQHIKDRLRADRKERKQRAKKMARMVQQQYQPTMDTIHDEVHGQVTGLQALRAQWANDLNMG